MKLVRVIDAVKVRNMCIKYDFYTCGSCEAYNHLLSDLCGYDDKEVAEKELKEIAFDIVDHSELRVFEEFLSDTRKINCIKEVVCLLANECCRTVVKESEKKLYKYRLSDAFNGDRWKFNTIEELKKFADDYSDSCEGDWMPIYRILDREIGKYRLMNDKEIKGAKLPN